MESSQRNNLVLFIILLLYGIVSSLEQLSHGIWDVWLSSQLLSFSSCFEFSVYQCCLTTDKNMNCGIKLLENLMSRAEDRKQWLKSAAHTTSNGSHWEYFIFNFWLLTVFLVTVFDHLVNPFLQEALAWSGTCSGFWCLMRVLQSILPLQMKSVGT